MEIDFAREAVRAAFRAGAELQGLIVLSKQNLSPEEHKEFAIGIAGAIYEIAEAVTNKALAAHPELAGEIEAEVRNSGAKDE